MLAFGAIGWQEIVIVGALFLLLFGAKRLPEIGQSLGKGIREFKNSLTAPDDEPKLGSGDSAQEQGKGQGKGQGQDVSRREEAR